MKEPQTPAQRARLKGITPPRILAHRISVTSDFRAGFLTNWKYTKMLAKLQEKIHEESPLYIGGPYTVPTPTNNPTPPPCNPPSLQAIALLEVGFWKFIKEHEEPEKSTSTNDKKPEKNGIRRLLHWKTDEDKSIAKMGMLEKLAFINNKIQRVNKPEHYEDAVRKLPPESLPQFSLWNKLNDDYLKEYLPKDLEQQLQPPEEQVDAKPPS